MGSGKGCVLLQGLPLSRVHSCAHRFEGLRALASCQSPTVTCPCVTGPFTVCLARDLVPTASHLRWDGT